MVTPSMEGVKGAGVFAVQVAHSVGEVRVPRLDDEVVVVAHQAPGVEAPAIPSRHAPQLVEEPAAVVVVQEAELLVVPARRDVVPGAGGEVAARSSHAATVALRCGA